MSSNKATKVLVASAVLILSVVWLVIRVKPAPTTGQFAYDLSSGRLFMVSKDAVAPMPGPGGEPDGAVTAIVYTCGSCADAASFRVAYLRKYTEQAQEALADPVQEPGLRAPWQKTVEDGERIAKPVAESGQSPEWVARSGTQGTALLASIHAELDRACDGQRAQYCLPQ